MDFMAYGTHIRVRTSDKWDGLECSWLPNIWLSPNQPSATIWPLTRLVRALGRYFIRACFFYVCFRCVRLWFLRRSRIVIRVSILSVCKVYCCNCARMRCRVSNCKIWISRWNNAGEMFVNTFRNMSAGSVLKLANRFRSWVGRIFRSCVGCGELLFFLLHDWTKGIPSGGSFETGRSCEWRNFLIRKSSELICFFKCLPFCDVLESRFRLLSVHKHVCIFFDTVLKYSMELIL